ncbi:hypothetical protein RRG08_009782 [Elysia crispata]|uniref:Uncharacterized protein n=1 Tax=Elysia crispata TaxID=231223 RepID=A0AAE1DL52_9GAST|nr:hypothetical protein RRG08_009782 [Elysia crispata]
MKTTPPRSADLNRWSPPDFPGRYQFPLKMLNQDVGASGERGENKETRLEISMKTAETAPFKVRARRDLQIRRKQVTIFPLSFVEVNIPARDRTGQIGSNPNTRIFQPGIGQNIPVRDRIGQIESNPNIRIFQPGIGQARQGPSSVPSQGFLRSVQRPTQLTYQALSKDQTHW